MSGPPSPRAAPGAADRGPLRERAPHRRGVGVADRDRERVGGVVGPRQLVEREQGLDHPLDLVLGGAAGAADGALDLLGRVGPARDPALAGGQQHHPAGLPDGERRARVGAEVQLLDRHRLRPVLVEQLGRRARGSSASRAAASAPARSAPRPRRAPPSARPAAPRRRSPCWRCPDRCRGRSSSRRGFCAARRTPLSARGSRADTSLQGPQRAGWPTCCSRARTRVIYGGGGSIGGAQRACLRARGAARLPRRPHAGRAARGGRRRRSARTAGPRSTTAEVDALDAAAGRRARPTQVAADGRQPRHLLPTVESRTPTAHGTPMRGDGTTTTTPPRSRPRSARRS